MPSASYALEYISFDDVHAAIYDTDDEDRESFANSLQRMLEDLLSLYTRHSSRLSSTDIESILDLESSFRSTINKVKIIDDETTLLNLADSDPAKVDSVWIRQVENTAKSLHETITLIIQIFGKFFPKSKWVLTSKTAQHRVNQTRAIALEGQRREQARLFYEKGYEQTRPGRLRPR